MGKSAQKTSTTSVDKSTQDYVNSLRQQAGVLAPQMWQQGAAGLLDPSKSAASLMNPFQQDVVNGVNSDFDRQRAAALTGGAQAATQAGAFGGSRSGVLQALALKDVNQNEAGTLANLRYSGYNDAMNAALARAQALMAHGQSLYNLGMGPLGQTTTESQRNPWYQDALKIAGTAAMFIPGGQVPGAAMNAVSGLAGGGGNGSLMNSGTTQYAAPQFGTGYMGTIRQPAGLLYG